MKGVVHDLETAHSGTVFFTDQGLRCTYPEKPDQIQWYLSAEPELSEPNRNCRKRNTSPPWNPPWAMECEYIAHKQQTV